MKSVIGRAVLSLAVLSFTLPAFANPHAASANGNSVNHEVVASASQTSVVNINTADAQTIINAHVKGIGKKRAAEIVAYRQQHGPFKSIDDLKNIRGVSQKVIDANRSRLTVS